VPICSRLQDTIARMVAANPATVLGKPISRSSEVDGGAAEQLEARDAGGTGVANLARRAWRTLSRTTSLPPSEYVPTPDTTPALSTRPQKFAPRGAAAAHIYLPRGRLVPHP